MSKKIHVRPSGSQSKIGFVAGIVFCLLGLFVVIPIFGPVGIIWTVFAGLITYTHWRNGFSDKKIDSHVIEIEDTDPDNITVTSHRGFGSYSVEPDDISSERRTGQQESMEERLKTLQSLYDQRLITREEYDEKKQEILKEL